MTSRPQNSTLYPGVHRSRPSRCLVWLQAKAGGPSCEHRVPRLEGSVFLSPETRSQLLPLTPIPRCHSRALTSSLLPGSRGSSHMLNLGRQRGSLAMASLSRRLDRPQSSPASLASARSTLPPQRGLRPGMGRGLARGPAGWLTTCLLSRGPAAAPVPCSAGPELRRHCLGRRVHPQAVCGSLI